MLQSFCIHIYGSGVASVSLYMCHRCFFLIRSNIEHDYIMIFVLAKSLDSELSAQPTVNWESKISCVYKMGTSKRPFSCCSPDNTFLSHAAHLTIHSFLMLLTWQYIPFSCCSPDNTFLSHAAHLTIHSFLMLLTWQYIPFSCCSPDNTFLSHAAHLTIHSFLMLLTWQYIPFSCCSPDNTFLSHAAHLTIHSFLMLLTWQYIPSAGC